MDGVTPPYWGMGSGERICPPRREIMLFSVNLARFGAG